jgi:hypothetical protein
MILDEEARLLGHLQTVTRDLNRRIGVGKERRTPRPWSTATWLPACVAAWRVVFHGSAAE